VLALTAADLQISRLYEGRRPVVQDADNETTTLPDLRTGKKFGYATRLKKALDKAIADIESWQNEFDPSWFLILKVGGQHIDKELNDNNNNNTQKADIIVATACIRDSLKDHPQQYISVLLPKEELEGAKLVPIPFGTAKLAQRAGSSKWLVLDAISCDSSTDFQQRMKTARDLARRLTQTDPATFSLLKCRGFVADKALLHFQLVFKAPSSLVSAPQTLRASLIAGDTNHSLSDRFGLARNLATAVCSVHTFGLVHKSIRPENILVFHDGDGRRSSNSLGTAFLVGFECIRPEEAQTKLRSDADWEKNLYRHPQRQGLRLRDPYVMQHDIYSLGVCLLEIGLWSSFVGYVPSEDEEDEGLVPVQSERYRFYEEGLEGEESSAAEAEAVKARLVELAHEPLRRRMGSRYARVVETCLTCLDEGNELFGDEALFQDEDGVLVAVRYIEQVSVMCGWEICRMGSLLAFADSFAAEPYLGLIWQVGMPVPCLFLIVAFASVASK
jgi:hypothetical protein